MFSIGENSRENGENFRPVTMDMIGYAYLKLRLTCTDT